MKIRLLYPAAIIILGLAVALRLSLFFENDAKITLPKNQNIKFIATLKQEPGFWDGGQIIKIGTSRVFANYYPKFHSGDKLLVDGKVDEQGNIFNAKIEKIGSNTNFLNSLSNLRIKLSENIEKLLPSKEATLVSGTVLGIDKISSDFREMLIKTGTIHVVVVSGQNLTLVAGIFMALAKYVGRKQSLLLATLAVVFYATLTGLEPPVVRASIMVIAATFAVFLGREIWPIWSLTIAALLICFVAPQSVFEASFQLTFMATLGIMTLGTKLTRLFKKFPVIGEASAISISAYLFTLPVILFHFGKISVSAPLVNVLVAEAIFPVMILGFAVILVSLISTKIAFLFALLAYVPAFYFVKVVEVFSKISPEINIAKGNLIISLIFVLFLVFIIYLWKSKKSYF